MQSKRKAFIELILIVTIACIVTNLIWIGYCNDKPEYELELLNQTTVEIKSNHTGKTYYCHPDSIQSIINLDNK
jgi:hypothetical protein